MRDACRIDDARTEFVVATERGRENKFVAGQADVHVQPFRVVDVLPAELFLESAVVANPHFIRLRRDLDPNPPPLLLRPIVLVLFAPPRQ